MTPPVVATSRSQVAQSSRSKVAATLAREVAQSSRSKVAATLALEAVPSQRSKSTSETARKSNTVSGTERNSCKSGDRGAGACQTASQCCSSSRSGSTGRRGGADCENEYINGVRPGFQKWRIEVVPKEVQLRTQLQQALASNNVEELQTAYRHALNRNSSTSADLSCETRLIAGILSKIHLLFSRRLQRATDEQDLECLSELDRSITDDPILTTFSSSAVCRRARTLLQVLRAMQGVEVAGKQLHASHDLWVYKEQVRHQETCLEDLKSAISTADTEGLDHEALETARQTYDHFSVKVKTLARLNLAISSGESRNVEDVIDEATRNGVIEDSELRATDFVRLELRLDDAIRTANVEEIKSVLLAAKEKNVQGIEESKVLEASRILVQEDLKRAIDSGQIVQLRTAIEGSSRLKLFGEAARTLNSAEQQLELLEAAEVETAQLTSLLLAALNDRDVAKLKNALVEAEKVGLKSPEVDRCRVVLCETELRASMQGRDINILKVKIPVGFELKVDHEILSNALLVVEEQDPKAAAWIRIRGAISSLNADHLHEAIRKAQAAGVNDLAIVEANKVLSQLQLAK